MAQTGRQRDDTVERAREICYQLFSRATSDPSSGRWDRLCDPGWQKTAIAAAGCLQEEWSGRGPCERAPGEGTAETLRLGEAFAHLQDRAAAEEAHRRAFGFLLARDCPPYETEYCPQTFTVYRAHRMADVAGFYRAFGLQPGQDVPERPDHISLELEFMAWLIGKTRRAAGVEEGDEARAVCEEAQAAFVREHLSWWVPAFCAALRKKAEGRADGPSTTFHGALADALASFVGFERAWLGVAPPTELASPNASEEAEEMACAACDLAAAGGARS